MNRYLREDIIKEAQYIVENKSTIRETASAFGISKTALHYYFIKILPQINAALYKEVRAILDKNKEERAYRGGIATRNKRIGRKEFEIN